MSMTAILTTGATSYTPMANAANTLEPANDHVVLRTAIQNMQGKVTWDGSKQRVDIQLGDIQAQLPVGTATATINGVKNSTGQQKLYRQWNNVCISQNAKANHESIDPEPK